MPVQPLHGLEIGAVDSGFEGKLHAHRALLLRLIRAVAAGVLLESRSDDLHEANGRSLLCNIADTRLKAPATLIHLLELIHADGFVGPRKLH